MATDLQQLQQEYRLQLRDVGCVGQKLHRFWCMGLVDDTTARRNRKLVDDIEHNIRTSYEAHKQCILAARKKSIREFTNER